MGDAHSITQDFLDRQGEVTVAGDLEATLEWCDLPCTLESLDGRIIATTTAELRAICAAFIDKLKSKQFTHMVRRCLEAEFKGDDTIWAAYETRYIRSGNLLTEDPYVSFIILKRAPDRWKISMIQFAVIGDSPANAILRKWISDAD
ncbi:hypothetical protein [Antarctobacter sp.]|uniref:hypothetical protein n=1 Tax=Antarctobacter sp. TaxID=1872577 RepID=UPI002B270497|nr:hypothetical protein [Antarctobacter sp.]